MRLTGGFLGSLGRLELLWASLSFSAPNGPSQKPGLASIIARNSSTNQQKWCDHHLLMFLEAISEVCVTERWQFPSSSVDLLMSIACLAFYSLNPKVPDVSLGECLLQHSNMAQSADDWSALTYGNICFHS